MKPRNPWAALPTIAIAAFIALTACSHLDRIVKYDVTAEYRGLEGKTIAVLVAADEFLLFRHPDEQEQDGRVVSGRLQENLEGARVVHPDLVVEWQEQNPYWQTLLYSELIEKVGTEAIVLIDIANYQLHEPGNRYEKRGAVTANVGVIEANAPDADDFTYFNTGSYVFPEDMEEGLINEDDESIQLGLLTLFSRDAAGLFYDHIVERKE